IVLVTRAPWPQSKMLAFHCIISGCLIHGLYLSGVFWAIARGMPAGTSALIVGLQPILTAVFAGFLLREKVTIRQWAGLILGLIGLALVLGPKLPDGGIAWGNTSALLLNLAALGGITFGTIYQKAFAANVGLRTGGLLQYIGALVMAATGVLIFETGRIEWAPELILAMTWLVLVLSIGAISLLMILIRRGAVSQVAALFYLVPPVTFLIAYFMFDEKLSYLHIAGIAVTAFAVWLARTGQPTQ
ncbi:MAG: DMT family transporter, partial [Fimbriimonadaceae bacterium]|nr:DMT family transporter [Alphaproteobacteria bacterium]